MVLLRSDLLSEVGAKAGTAEGSERLLAKLVEDSRSVGVAGEVGVPGINGLGAGRSSAQCHTPSLLSHWSTMFEVLMVHPAECCMATDSTEQRRTAMSPYLLGCDDCTPHSAVSRVLAWPLTKPEQVGKPLL